MKFGTNIICDAKVASAQIDILGAVVDGGGGDRVFNRREPGWRGYIRRRVRRSSIRWRRCDMSKLLRILLLSAAFLLAAVSAAAAATPAAQPGAPNAGRCPARFSAIAVPFCVFLPPGYDADKRHNSIPSSISFTESARTSRCSEFRRVN